MLRILLLILITSGTQFCNAQELNCQVSIITDAKLEVTTTEQQALEQLEEVIFDFMNSTKWTKDKFNIEVSKWKLSLKNPKITWITIGDEDLKYFEKSIPKSVLKPYKQTLNYQ